VGECNGQNIKSVKGEVQKKKDFGQETEGEKTQLTEEETEGETKNIWKSVHRLGWDRRTP